MSNEPSDVVQRILNVAIREDADALSESMISLTDDALYDDALGAFGGWDVALATALKQVLARAQPRQQSHVSAPRPSQRDAEPREISLASRVAHSHSMRSVYAWSLLGYIIRVPAESFDRSVLPAFAVPPLGWRHDEFGQFGGFYDVGDGAVFGFTADGQTLGWDKRAIPDLSDENLRRLGARVGANRWAGLGPRLPLGPADLVVSVSRRGKVKASKSKLMPHPVNSEGCQAFLVDGDDYPVAFLPGSRSDYIFLASSNGFGISFPLEELRPMGLKAAGVKGMGLRGNSAVAGAFINRGVSQVAFVTRMGLGKRVELREFRPQSRAGLGLVAQKVSDGDAIAAIVGCEDNSDLAVVTQLGGVLRLPAQAFPLSGRPARGERVCNLSGGDEVVGLVRMLPSDFSNLDA